MDEDPNKQRRRRVLAFSSAVAAAIRCLQNNQPIDRRFLPIAERDVVHEGGPVGAYLLALRVLEGSESRFFELFRMDKQTFHKLHEWLLRHTELESTRYQASWQKLMIFLWIVGFGATQRQAAHAFEVSQSSISQTMNNMLEYMQALCKAFVKLPGDDYLAEDVEFGGKLDAFSGAIGAIDGTHIHARVKLSEQKDYRNRKGYISQNVFAAVRFDGTFSFVLAGAEGSVNDATLQGWAFGRGFSVPDDRFYLADSGFGSKRGLLKPFLNVRYHLQEWRSSERSPRLAKELYNLRHSRLRVVVEQVFGMLKRKLKIVRSAAPEYSITLQRDFIYAVCALHNFIRMDGEPDEDPERSFSDEEKELFARRRQLLRGRYRGKTPEEVRRIIAVRMWRKYNRSE